MVNPPEALPGADHGNPMVPLYEMAEIDEFAGTLRSPRMVQLGSCRSGRTRFRNGDVLFAKITPCVQNGKCALADGIEGGLGFGSSEFYVLRAGPSLLPDYLFYYLRQKSVVQAAVDSFSGTSGRQRVPPQFWEALSIPLPPLAVQERIVQILQKADEIRRKRQEALALADKILPSMFLDMFGDPGSNPKGWDSFPLEQVLDACEAGVWGPEVTEEEGGFRILRSTNMPLDGRVDFSDVAVRAVGRERATRFVLEEGDILLNRSSGSKQHIGKVSLFRQPVGDEHPYLFSNFVQRLRVKKARVVPEYLFYFLRTEFARTNLRRAHATSSGLRNINMTEYVRQPVLVPPLNLQEHFARVAKQHETTRSSAQVAMGEASRILSALMDRAFTGELTAEWEAANAKVICQRQVLEEQVPRLLALDILAEKAGSAAPTAPEAGLLLTAMMKLLFLVQMKGSARRRFYHFVPYHYGPFAKELYDDLERLQQEGLVRIEQADEDKTRLLLADAERAGQMVAQLPEDLRQDVRAVLDEYGGLTHNQLLARVYKEFPAYARKSRLRRTAAKKGRRGRSAR